MQSCCLLFGFEETWENAKRYLLNDIKYHGWVVTENFEALPRKDKLRLTNSCDKQFTSLDEFKINARKFLEKERY